MTTPTMQAPTGACQLLVNVGAITKLADDDGASSVPKRRFSGKANSGGVIEGHWYWGNFAIDMKGLQVNRQDLPVLRDHRSDDVLGYTTKVTKGDEGIDVEGFLVGATESAREVIAQLEAGVPLQMSVYVPPKRILRIEKGESLDVNGRKLTGPGHVFTKSTLREATITALGADEATGAALLSARADGVPTVEVTKLRQEQETQPMGETTTPLTAASLAEQHPAVHTEVRDAAFAEGRTDGIKAERERIAFAQSKSKGIEPALLQEAIDKGWDRAEIAERFLDHLAGKRTERLAALRSEAPDSTGGQGTDPDETQEFTEGDADGADATSEPDDEAKWKREFAASKAIRDEFVEERFYLAHKRNGGD